MQKEEGRPAGNRGSPSLSLSPHPPGFPSAAARAEGYLSVADSLRVSAISSEQQPNEFQVAAEVTSYLKRKSI